MGKNKHKAMHTAKEEKQGKRVLVGLGVAAVVLLILMFVAFSYV